MIFARKANFEVLRSIGALKLWHPYLNKFYFFGTPTKNYTIIFEADYTKMKKLDSLDATSTLTRVFRIPPGVAAPSP